MANIILNQIKKDLQAAMKSQNQEELLTLRYLLAEINNMANSKYTPDKGGIPVGGIPDEDIISVLQKVVKTHHESIEAFKAGNRQDLVAKEKAELAILQKYLPAQMSEEEIEKVVNEIRATGITDFGQVMKEVMAKVKGKADGSVVSKIVREMLLVSS